MQQQEIQEQLPLWACLEEEEKNKPIQQQYTKKFRFLEFFAGSGLVTLGLSDTFRAVWANDISERKASVYQLNHGQEHFHLGDIKDVAGRDLPDAEMSWSSFPCQDLSLAGNMSGIRSERSGMVWEWLRVIDELQNRPAILAAENVVGLISSKNGQGYLELHNALTERGYKVGAIILDAIKWVPQSRSRVIIIAVRNDITIPDNLYGSNPNWLHNKALIRLARKIDDWIWWKMPEPIAREYNLEDILEKNVECYPEAVAKKHIDSIPKHHLDKLLEKPGVYAGYKRTRNGKVVLELRFDGVAGCLRTPEGGSSRQYLVFNDGEKITVRLITVREAARLMGVPDSYELPGSYNDGYKAMGDAVAVPVAEYVGKHILYPIVDAHKADMQSQETE